LFFGGAAFAVTMPTWKVSAQYVQDAQRLTAPRRRKTKRNTLWIVIDYKDATPYRSLGIIHRKQGEPSSVLSSRLPVNNSGGAMFNFYTFYRLTNLAAGFAARPGRRMGHPKRSTFSRRASPPDGGLCPMTNTQNFSPASGSDEFYKAFAGGGQVGISH